MNSKDLDSSSSTDAIGLATKDEVFDKLKQLEGKLIYPTILEDTPDNKNSGISNDELTCNSQFINNIVVKNDTLAKLSCNMHIIQLSSFEE